MTERGEKILLIVSFAALLAVVAARDCFRMRVPGRPGIADQEKMLRDADDWIVGDSNVYPNPVSRVALANTRFGPIPALPALRQVTRGGAVPVQINNEV